MKKIINIANKILLRLAVPLITIFIILIVAWAVTYTITGSKAYYRSQFEENNTAEKLRWVYDDPESGTRVEKSYDSDDLEIIMNRIVDYMMNRSDSMQVIDSEGMNVFSNQALKHMADVKAIYQGWTVITIILIPILIALFVYFFFKKEEIAPRAKKQVYITFSIIGGILLILSVMLIIDSSFTFTEFHHILFPKIEDFNDAFFSRKSNYEEEYYINNLLLVQILTEDIFIDAAWMIICAIITSTGIWVSLLLIYTRKLKEKKSKINLA